MQSNILRQSPVTYDNSFRVEKHAQDKVKADWTLQLDGWFISRMILPPRGYLATFGCHSYRDVIGI